VSTAGSARRNIELKAADRDPARSLEVCLSLGAADCGVIRQRDTYFQAAHGRLKLREETPGRPHLIQYERANRPEERQSTYRIIEVTDAAALKAALAAALGLRGVVAKRRHLFRWEHVRIHLDEVHDLGHFIEFEAAAAAHSDLSEERRRVSELRQAFDITDDRLQPTGYADQLCPAP
jgi:predicted adenylyl cyclase CyaB